MTTVTDLVEETGLTYRQLDWWIRQGYVACEDPTPGSGFTRVLTDEQADFVRTMSDLIKIGTGAAKAHDIATTLLDTGRLTLGQITITKERTPQ